MATKLIQFLLALLLSASFVHQSNAVLILKHLPATTKVQKKEITVYVTRTGHKYHQKGCRYLRQSCIAMKLSEARKSYSACSVCNPPK